MSETLTSTERLELIRQIEKSNLSDQQLKQLVDWAQDVIIGSELLSLLFTGNVEIVDVCEDGPIVQLTPQGEAIVMECDYDEGDEEDEEWTATSDDGDE